MISLGIDTSNYTTSVALCEDGRITGNDKLPLPVKAGERGLRQSDAVFLHIKNIPGLTNFIENSSPDVIAFSSKPRSLPGSYMPCFLVGETVALFAASLTGCRVYDFSHQQGHIRAALYSSDREDLINKEFLAFHVSGGTTELLHFNNGKYEIVGGTRDITAGQIIDRVAVKLGMPFPGGASLEKSALEYNASIAEKNKITVKDGYCNLAGVENIASKMIEDGRTISEISFFVLSFVRDTLIEMTRQISIKYPELPVILAGGVMSNGMIKEAFKEKFDAYFATPEFSSDNAAGIALLGYDKAVRENG